MDYTWAVLLAWVLVLVSLSLLVFPRLIPATLAVLLAAAWWPANNRVLEGPTLVHLSSEHGVTRNDLLGVLAVAAAVQALLRREHDRARRLRIFIGWAVVLLAGVIVALFTGG